MTTQTGQYYTEKKKYFNDDQGL
uniref:Uncharacterized protein n=1 Tax=Rhizophora mucronata TaxID=61149 RepID=A0A2P2PGB3_RHIMU